MNGFLNDLRYGLRQLAAKPDFAAAAILTLALGIGANTAVFSFLSGYLLKPLPYNHSRGLVRVAPNFTVSGGSNVYVSLALYKVIRERTDAFAATAFYDGSDFNLMAGGRAERTSGVYASPSLFQVLGTQPLLGHVFTASNMQAGSDHVAVISYGLWRRSFGAHPGIVGKKIKLGSDLYRVIGVMPKGFAFPNRTAELWVPYVVTPEALAPQRDLVQNIRFIGRLKPGSSRDAAEMQIQHAVMPWIQNTIPANLRKIALSSGLRMDVQPWRQVLLGDRPTTLWLLQGAVLLILLITCVNVANMLLSRILGRSHEIAMRSTLGATRMVLARQCWGRRCV